MSGYSQSSLTTSLNVSVIANSRLNSFSRAVALAEEHWFTKINVALFSALPVEDVVLPYRFIGSFIKLPEHAGKGDYSVVAKDKHFKDSMCCFLFLTRLVPKEIYMSVNTINFHPSLLPEYPGLSGFERATAARQLALTAHQVDASTDAGKVLRQYSVVPFPDGAPLGKLKRESSLLCTAAILSVLSGLPDLAERRREDFVSGASSINSVLSVGTST
jgi:hypothetical protein